jgi:hypothetical protein
MESARNEATPANASSATADDPRSTRRAPTAADVLRRAFSTYRGRFVVVVGMAILAFVPLAVIDAAVDLWAEDYRHDHNGAAGLAVFLPVLLGTSAVVFGSAFFADLLDHVVREHQHGHERHRVRHIVRTLPYRRLIGANVLLSVLTTIGLALFLVPGLIVFTIFCLVGPLIRIERLPVLAAFRRSVELVRHRLWLALLVVAIPVIFETSAHHSVAEFVVGRESLLAAAILGGLFAATVGAFVGLNEVTLAYLLVQDEQPTTQPAQEG